jgi:hypothetical protein
LLRSGQLPIRKIQEKKVLLDGSQTVRSWYAHFFRKAKKGNSGSNLSRHGGHPMREALSIMLVVMLASPAAPAQPPASTVIKEQVLKFGPGSPVEVRLADKSKLRGRLSPVNDSGFELQTVKGNKIDTVQISFDQVKSIKDTTKKSFGHSLAKGFLIAGIVFGVILGITAITCATKGCFG